MFTIKKTLKMFKAVQTYIRMDINDVSLFRNKLNFFELTRPHEVEQ